MLRPLAHHPHMAAAGLSSLGRGNDSMLVHMTPHEVGGLRQLAMAAGGDLSINPHTGLPEAGFLSAILPMIAGGLLTMTGVGAPLAAGIVAAGDTAVTGSWKKGLMAGLGAYGGASLAGGLGAAGEASTAALPGTATSATPAIGNVAAGNGIAALPDAVSGAVPGAVPGVAAAPAIGNFAAGNGIAALPGAVPGAVPGVAATPAMVGISPTTGTADLMSPTPPPVPTAAPIAPTTAATPPSPNAATYEQLSPIQKTAFARLAPAQQAEYLQNIGTQNFMKTAASSGSWAQNGQGLSNIGSGFKTLGNGQGWANLGKTMGAPGIAMAATPVLQGISALDRSGVPATAQTPAEYYQTEYDPRTQTYKRGSWSSQYAGQGYRGAPGTDQSTTNGPVGSYANPYTSLAPVNPYAVNGKKGGGVKSLASGGQSSSNLQDYYKGLISGTTSTSPLKNPSPDANNAFMASIGQGTAPATPTGGTGMGFLSNQQAQSATNPYGYVAPPPGATGATTTTTKPGATGTATPYIPSNFNLGGFGNLFGGGYGTTSPDASGPANVPSYSWDPATQTYTQTNSGYGGGGGGGGKAAGGGIASLNSFSGGGTTLGSYSDGGRLLRGPGDGMSDNIPAHIAGAHPQPAALADGEFVIPADVVSHLGNGSTDAGSKVLYKMMDKVRRARTGNPKQGQQINPNKFIPA